jgi:hypothetical protein
MKLNEAIVILENHNEWMRDKEVPNSIVMVDPAELGIAIDVVVSEVKKFNISGVSDIVHRAELKVLENVSDYIPCEIYSQAIIFSQKKRDNVR